MSITSDAATRFRDYVTDGVPASGAYAPTKAHLRQSLADIDTAIAAAVAAAVAAQADAVQSGTYIAKGSILAPPGYFTPTGYFGGPACGLSNVGAEVRASADNWDLFNIWWNTLLSIQLKDSGGSDVAKGASATADFAAGKRFPIPVPDVDFSDLNINWFVKI